MRKKRIALFLTGLVLSLLACLFLSGCCTTDFMPTWAWSSECVSAHPGVPFMRRDARAAPISCLPNPALTPGVADPTVTAEMLRNPTFIKSRRNVSEATKKEVFRRYGIPWTERRRYEVDHYIPLCQGGENSISNLWCEPWDGPFGAHTKDRLEVTLHRRVNKGLMTLKESQDVYLRGPWTNALATYGIAPSTFKNTLFKLTHDPVK